MWHLWSGVASGQHDRDERTAWCTEVHVEHRIALPRQANIIQRKRTSASPNEPQGACHPSEVQKLRRHPVAIILVTIVEGPAY